MIFLLMTAPVGTAIATCLVRVPSACSARFTASVTASRLLMLPSTTASRASGSIAYARRDSRSCRPSTSSSIFTEDELISSPNKGGALAVNRSNFIGYFPLRFAS
jgi:hypothetical protein